jgi:hypothetical protein
MPENNNEQNNRVFGEIHEEWVVPEFDKHERSKAWYISASIIAILMMIFAFFTANFLFAVIIIVTALIVILHDGQEPGEIKVKITDNGVVLGRNFYEYDEIKDFSVIHKPQYGIKNLYLNFNNILRHRITIPLNGIKPLQIRKILLQYLPEDMERTDPPISESISRFFKI